MANRIRLIRLDGNDIVSKSMATINQNYNLIENAINAQIGNDINDLDVGDVNWIGGTAYGPKGNITLSNGNSGQIKPIPAADANQSGVVTTTQQSIAGLKTFENGIATNTISDKSGHRIVLADGNTVYIGGENGMILTYSGDTLVDVVYGFADGVSVNDLLGKINNISALLNDKIDDIEAFKQRLQEIMQQYSSDFNSQADTLNELANTLANFDFTSVQNQLDNMVEHWFGTFAEMNNMRTLWLGSAKAENHVSDTFTITDKDDDDHYKQCYIFVDNGGGSYIWRPMSESEYDAVVWALLNSLEAISIADGKCTTFYQATPPVPCHVGDIWITSESFYMDGNVQTFQGPSDDESEWLENEDIIPRHTILFCIHDNEFGPANINDWSKDMKTWAQIEFEKQVEFRFKENEDTLIEVQNALSAIDDDKVFSAFEKNNFLYNTWYMIAGSYVYDGTTDGGHTIPENTPWDIPSGFPINNYLGTSENGSFRDTITGFLGDGSGNVATHIDDPSDLYQLVEAFKNLGHFLQMNHLFDNQLVSTNFWTSRTGSVSADGSNLGIVAKQELAELLYNYYREENECKRQAYVNAVSSMFLDLDNQSDHMIQNWFKNGVPTTQDELPWRYEDEDSSEYDENDNKHISDTLVDLSQPQRDVYKFLKKNDSSDTIGDDDKAVVDTLFYWQRIGGTDLDNLLDYLDIDIDTAIADGTINVFNTLPNNYSYGDIWFCRADQAGDDGYSDLTNEEKAFFKYGCIYYCKELDFPDGSDSDSDRDLIRKEFHSEDWLNAYEQGEDFISKFAGMLTDGILNVWEKQQILREWYEIAGFNLIGNDSDPNDDIIMDVFDDDTSNQGSFRWNVNNASNFLRGISVIDGEDFNNFIGMTITESVSRQTLLEKVADMTEKFSTLHSCLMQCGCDDFEHQTNLNGKVFEGLVSPYNCEWNVTIHVTMISDLFTQYLQAESDVKAWIQNSQAEELQDQIDDMGSELDNLSNLYNQVNNTVQALADINDDTIFTIYEKRSFLHNTWYPIAGSYEYTPESDVTYNAAGYPTQNPLEVLGFLGSEHTGSFYKAMSTCIGDDGGISDNDIKIKIKEIITAFKALGQWCDTFGVFENDENIENTNNFTLQDREALTNKLYNYYAAEDACKRLGQTNAILSTVNNLNSQEDHMIQTWYGNSVPTSQDLLPWRTVEEATSDYNENDPKHKGDVFVRLVGQIPGEVYKFSEVNSETGINIEAQNGDITVTGGSSLLFWKKMQGDADTNTILSLLGIDPSAWLDGTVTVYSGGLPTNYSYGDIWFPDANYTVQSITFNAGGFYYCSNDDLRNTTQSSFEAGDWSSGTSFIDPYLIAFMHFTDDNILSKSEKQQLLSKWMEIAFVNLYGNDGILNDDIIEDIFINNPLGRGSFRSTINLCSQLMNMPPANSSAQYSSLKSAIAQRYSDLSTDISNLEVALNALHTLLLNCSCYDLAHDTDLTGVNLNITSLSTGEQYNASQHYAIFSTAFTNYNLAESNVIGRIQLIYNSNLQTQIDNLSDSVNTAQLAAEAANAALEAINNDEIFSAFEKSMFLTNTFIPISGSRAYHTGSGYDVSYEVIDYTQVPTSNPITTVSSFLGAGPNGSFINTIGKCVGSSSTISDSMKVRLGELISAYKKLGRFCEQNGLVNLQTGESLQSTSFKDLNGYVISGSQGKALMAECLYDYNREENECNKLLYIDAVSNMISSITDQLDGQVKRYYRNFSPPDTSGGCEVLFECTADDFDKHVNDEFVDMNSNNTVYLFILNEGGSSIQSSDVSVSGTNYYWKKVSNDDLQELIARIEDYEQNHATSDGSIQVFGSLPNNYSYGDIWFCGADYPSDNPTFENGHIYWCFANVENFSPFNASHWKSAYSYGDNLLAQLAHITDDGYISAIEKSSLVQKWCEIAGGGNVPTPTSFSVSSIMNSNNNVGSFRSVLSNWYSSFNTGQLSSTNYDTAINNTNSPHRNVVTDLVKKLNDVYAVLRLCECYGSNATEETYVENMTIPSGTFEYSGNATLFNGQIWNNTVLPTVFATYYFEETNLRNLVQQDEAANVAQEVAVQAASQAVDAQMEDIREMIQNITGSEINILINDNRFSVVEKTKFLHNVWQRITGTTTYSPNNDYANNIDSDGKLTGEYLGTSSENAGSFRTLLSKFSGFVFDSDENVVTHQNGQITDLIEALKRFGEECNKHGLFAQQLIETEFGESTGDVDDLYDKLYHYYNAEEMLRLHLQNTLISSNLAEFYAQDDGTIAIYSKPGPPPINPSGLLNLWFNGNVPDGVTIGSVISNHVGDEYRCTTNGINYVFSEGDPGESDSESFDLDGSEPYGDYMWLASSGSSLEQLISTVSALAEGYNAAMANSDGTINVFGPEKLPEDYNYGDIWFFGGVDAIAPQPSQSVITQFDDSTKWVAGNVYYCNVEFTDNNPYNGFSSSHWVCGVRGSILTQMTTDRWLSITEKQILNQKWYDITGTDFTTLNNSVQYSNFKGYLDAQIGENTSSFKTLQNQFNELTGSEPGNGGSGNGSGGNSGGGTPSMSESSYMNQMISGLEDAAGNVGSDSLYYRKNVNDYYICVANSEKDYRILLGFKRAYDNVWYSNNTASNEMSLNIGLNTNFDYTNQQHFLKEVKVLQIEFVDNSSGEVVRLEDLGKISNDTGNGIDINVSISGTSFTVKSNDETKIKICGYSYSFRGEPGGYEHESGDNLQITADVENEYKLYVYVEMSSPSIDMTEVEGYMSQLYDDIWNIYRIMTLCECHDTSNGKYLVGLTISGLVPPFDNITGSVHPNHPTIISDIFNQYYSDEQNLRVEMTELQIESTDIEIPGLSQEDGSLVLTSCIYLKNVGDNDEVTGGLCGITDNDNSDINEVGMWFGGNIADAANSTVPVKLTKSGYESKIGPLKVGGEQTASNDHIYIGDKESGNVTVIGKDYISMGTSYENSQNSSDAKTYSTIYLSRDGVGSKIGPLSIEGNNDNRMVVFGEKRYVYSFNFPDNFCYDTSLSDNANYGLYANGNPVDNNMSLSHVSFTYSTINSQLSEIEFDINYYSATPIERPDVFVVPVNNISHYNKSVVNPNDAVIDEGGDDLT